MIDCLFVCKAVEIGYAKWFFGSVQIVYSYSKMIAAKVFFSAKTRVKTLSQENWPMRASHFPKEFGSRYGFGLAKNVDRLHFVLSQNDLWLSQFQPHCKRPQVIHAQSNMKHRMSR
jgi:hypothetical protein